MNKNDKVTTTLVQVARLYYEENRSQQEIADQIGVSRSLVALYLKMARERGIVRTKVINPAERFECKILQLKRGGRRARLCVVPGSHNLPALTLRAVSGAAARFLEDHLRDGDVLGCGWGRSVRELVNLIAASNPRSIEVVPLMGESGFTGSYTQLNEIVLQAAAAFGGRAFFLHAPMLVGSRQLRDALMKDEVVGEVVKRWDRLTVACVGIGALPPASGQVLYIGEQNVAGYAAANAVGDICARYFNLKGKYVRSDLNERLLGISLHQFERVRCVVAVAHGTEKLQAVIGGLRTGLITDLFVDEDLGRAVLAELQRPGGPAVRRSAL